MQEHTTYPALLAVETMPAPLSSRPATPPAQPVKKQQWPRWVLITIAVLVIIWTLKHAG